MLISNGEEEEQCHLSTSVRSKRVYSVNARRQSKKSGAECSQQEPLLKMFFSFKHPQDVEVNALELKGSQNS